MREASKQTGTLIIVANMRYRKSVFLKPIRRYFPEWHNQTRILYANC
jgi:hypothetical protein